MTDREDRWITLLLGVALTGVLVLLIAAGLLLLGVIPNEGGC